jgi:hypothetical protein
MRKLLVGLTIGLGLIAGSAALLAARQQATPGMSPARFWINNRTREEAVAVSIANVDPKAPPVPVSVNGFAAVDFTDRAKATLYDVHARAQTVELAHQRWEYRELTFASGDDRVAALNRAGADGWEATGMTAQADGRSTVLLKRPR